MFRNDKRAEDSDGTHDDGNAGLHLLPKGPSGKIEASALDKVGSSADAAYDHEYREAEKRRNPVLGGALHVGVAYKY